MPNLKITPELVHLAYNLSKKVNDKKLLKKEARAILTENGRMKESTANDFIYNFPHLLKGTKYTRTFNAYAIDYFLGQIYKDYSIKGLSNALRSLRKHIVYYENKRNTNMLKTKAVLNKYNELLKTK
jgi:5-methylcytosine-specific restriction protein A